ncbi:MAG: hypothetical protein HZC40_19390 [Chloroflexi bacterium]|nr:hypothetical protein [Chloroflexota bacterium]
MAGLVNVFVNDPNARGLGLQQVQPPTAPSRFTIPGWNGAGGLFNPGTQQFQAGMLHVVLNQTYVMWSDFFNGDFAWQPRVNQLPVAPRAGQDLNAYYDRVGLKFFFANDQVTGATLYTCESADVVAHECGHAILDARHPDYWDSLLGETAAFHEAFGDVSAILITLADPRVRAAILAENNGDLAKSNAVTRLAEQLARGLANNGFAQAVVSPDALRDAVNTFRYRDPDQLPARTPASKLSSESHNFSRVFSGAFYNLLVVMYTQLRQADPALGADAALEQARYDAGHLIAQGLLLAPRGDALFKSIVTAMFAADAQMFAGKYFGALRKAFVGRRIIKASEADALKKSAGGGTLKTSARGITAMSAAPVSVETIERKLGAPLPSEFIQALRERRQDLRLMDDIERRDASRVLHYESTRTSELKGKSYGIAAGATIDLSDAVAVQLAEDGTVIAAQMHRADRAYEKRIQDHVVKLVERKRVYDTAEGEQVDSEKLIAEKKPYFIAFDADGSKRVRRAFIACAI